MTELTEQQIRDHYTTANLTPVMCVLGGSHGYVMPNPVRHDYLGYHTEDTGQDIIFNDATTRLQSFPVSMIREYVEGQHGPKMAMYTIDNWIYHQLIFSEDPQYTNIKTQIVDSSSEDWMKFYGFFALQNFKLWKAEPTDTKLRNRAVRIALTMKYYLDHGTLECNWTALTTEYPINDDAARDALRSELKPLFLNLIIDHFSWSAIG